MGSQWFADASGNTFYIGFFENLDAARQFFRFLQSNGNWNFDSGLALLPSQRASVRMVVIEKDGTVSDMCGNGARAVGALLHAYNVPRTIEVDTEIIFVEKLSNENFSVVINSIVDVSKSGSLTHALPESRLLKISGEPHVVIRVEIIDNSLLEKWGSYVVPHANCTVYVQHAEKEISARTYERGVHRITQSCGTGSVAAVWHASKFGSHHGMYHVTMHDHVLKVEVAKNTAHLIGPVSLSKM